MGTAQERALTIRDRFGISEIPGDMCLDQVLRAVGIQVIEWHRATIDMKEIYYDGVVLIRADLSSEWKRWLKAHSLGHHLLHTGDQLVANEHISAHQEQQAEIFAGWFIFGRWPPAAWMGLTITVPMAAFTGRVPIECVERWWSLVQ